MKVAITGHSKGLGKEFFNAYSRNDNTVVGFSRSNGYDLRDWNKMQLMLDQIEEFDIFINCAKPDFVQTTVLYELWKRWKGQQKTIINISTILTYYPTCPKDLFADPAMDMYRTAKQSLNEASAQLSFKSPLPNIILVKPGHLYDNPATESQLKKTANWVNFIMTSICTANENNLKLYEITI